MIAPKLHEIKRERKKSLFFRELSQMVGLVSNENSDAQKVYVTRVDFSQDCGILYVYLAMYDVYSEEVFDRALAALILYKPSIRKDLAQNLNQRYTPDIVFLYDEHKEKQDRINQLLDSARQSLGDDKNN